MKRNIGIMLVLAVVFSVAPAMVDTTATAQTGPFYECPEPGLCCFYYCGGGGHNCVCYWWEENGEIYWHCPSPSCHQ